MLQVARLSPKSLGDARELVESFIRSQQNPDGAFRNRAGDSDLYYTVFGIEALIALQAEPPIIPVDTYLRTCNDGLDFVHRACLARAWAGITKNFSDVPVQQILSEIEKYRTPDGGYNQSPAAEHGTAYAAFLALGAYQDFGVEVPNAQGLLNSLESLRSKDGGYGNLPSAPVGVTTATAAVIATQRQFHQTPDPALAQWLVNQHAPTGGFFALPGAPIPDLLSTATALHALSGLHVPMNGLREPCLDFIDTLWTNRGGFYGHWSDDGIDTEYTYYGLLAIGHLTE
jgi:prenyltransferase beta subunit